MGLYPQPNDWTCGPFALKHALVALGRIVEGEAIAKLAGSHWWAGTDELRLASAARKNGCHLEHMRARRPDRARKALVAELRARRPVLLCVDDWGHWITVVRSEGTSFVVIDSDLDPVLNVLTWSQLNARWRYYDVDYDEDDPPLLYDLYPVVPQFRVRMRADFSVQRARFLRRSENRNLAEHWNAYLEDLLAICKPPAHNMGERLSMAELLRRNQDMLMSRLDYWYGDVDQKSLTRLFGHFRFVAETYGLSVPASSARQAVADLAILATLWVTAERGVAAMYGAGS